MMILIVIRFTISMVSWPLIIIIGMFTIIHQGHHSRGNPGCGYVDDLYGELAFNGVISYFYNVLSLYYLTCKVFMTFIILERLFT